ncbi:hypothetical protein LZZ85_00670 [Terrimonas sp. NA20]|uniref:WSN domain-containing protein n=1 Tax=Terrimonas ginsenosidimutans TaxID=2908004 RepID=A0ABS9KKA7_9BACT|nr:hypothetical protein [Terrimonas ginsenosidimutans]MCG2612763.1 hypothetical protein [Terrimonas ginsenosidimutans]
MSKRIFVFLASLFPFIIFAQSQAETSVAANVNTDSLLKVFQKRIDTLESTVKVLTSSTAQSTANDYSKSYRNSLLAIELLSSLHTTVGSIISDRNQAEASNLLNQVNNPTSDQLGFIFTDQVLTFAEQVISSANIVDEQKNKIRNTVKNIVDGLKTSFPPLNIVTSVISSFASFNIPFIDKLKKKIKGGDSLAIKAVSPITQNMLKQFSSAIMPYIEFYQNLNNSSLLFSSDLNFHKAKYEDYYPSIKALASRYQNELGIDINGIIGSPKDVADKLFESNTAAKNAALYKVVLQKEEVKKLGDFTVQTAQLARDFKSFYNDYYRVLLKNFAENLTLLNDAKRLPGANSSTIDKLINQLALLRKGNDENDPGFEVKFKRNLEIILSKISQITH